MEAASEHKDSPRSRVAANRRYFSRSRKLSLLQRFFLNLALVALPVAVYYFAVIQGQVQDERDRAFRALAELEQRIANYFQVAKAYEPTEHPSPSTNSRASVRKWPPVIDRQEGGLGLDGLVDSTSEHKGDASCASVKSSQPEFYVQRMAEQAGRGGYRVYRCKDKVESVVSFPLDAPLRSFRDLREFDHVIIAAPDGTTLAIRGSNVDVVTPGRSIQQEDEISGVATPRDVKAILKLAALEPWTRDQAGLAAPKDAKDGGTTPDQLFKGVSPSPDASPGDVVEIQHEIGGQRYTIQIKPYHLPIQKNIRNDVSAAGYPEKVLYLIGFRALGPWNLPTRAIDPLHAWFLAATILVFMLTSPLIRLMLLESHDSVTRSHGRLVAVSSVGLAGLLALIVLTFLADRTLTGFLRSGAANYSRALLDTLHAEMAEALWLLDAQRDYYDGRKALVPLRYASIPKGAGSPASGKPEPCSETNAALKHSRVKVNDAGGKPLRNWYPLESVNKDGVLAARELVFGQCEPPLLLIPFNHREYFKSLSERHVWIWRRAQVAQAHWLIDAQRDYYDGSEPKVPWRLASIATGAVSPVSGKPELCSANRKALNYSWVKVNDAGGNPLLNWSPLESSVQVNNTGFATRGLLFGQCEPPLPLIELNQREYVRSLSEGRAWIWRWRPHDLAQKSGPSSLRSREAEGLQVAPFSGPYVAQRLFNLRNGKKAMQFAIPRHWPGKLSNEERAPPFKGVVAGNAPLYPFTLAVPPLEYGFAVFDLATGTVLLHDDDARSLVENLYLETERDVRLLAAVGSGTESTFIGVYRGAMHLFQYTPVPDSAWGLVVTYPLLPVRAAITQAAISSVAIGGSLLGILSLFYFYILRTGSRITTWAWPQWRLREAYGYFALLLRVYLVFELVCFLLADRAVMMLLVTLSAGFVACCGFALLSVHPITREPWRKPGLVAALVLPVLMAWISLASASWTDSLARPAVVVLLCTVLLGLVFVAWRRILRQSLATDPYEAQPGFSLPTCRIPSWFPRRIASAGQVLDVSAALSPRLVRQYRCCVLLMLLILGTLPATAVFVHSYGWQLDGLLRIGLARTAKAMETRFERIREAQDRDIQDPIIRHLDYPPPWVLARAVPMPGIRQFALRDNDLCLAPDVLRPRDPEKSPEDYLGKACQAAAGPRPTPPAWDVVHWVGWQLSGVGRREAHEAALGYTSTIDRSTVDSSLAPVDHQPRVMNEWPSGRRVSAALALPPRPLVMIPIPLRGQVGVTNWGLWVWLPVIVLVLMLPLIALVAAVVTRLTGLSPTRNAKSPANPQTLDLSMLRALTDAMAARLGGSPRILFVDDDTALPGPPSDARSALEHAVHGARRFFPADDGAMPQGHVRVDLLHGDLGCRYEKLYSHVLLVGLDVALAGGDVRRQAVLDLVERLVGAERVQTYILADFLPMGPLMQPMSYPGSEMPEISSAEASRWRHVFSRLHWWSLGEFRADSAWEPCDERSGAQAPSPPTDDVRTIALLVQVEQECSVLWPRLEYLRRDLRREVCEHRVRSAEQITERVYRESHGLLARMWVLCTVAERLALYQLAQREIPNPRYPDTLAALAHRGLVRNRPAPEIASAALRRFVLEAEAPSVFAEWQEDAAQGAWQSLRGPLVLVILLLVAWLSYSAGQVFAALAAVLTSTLSFAGNIFSAVNLLKGSSGGGKS
ncbi:MAG: hypothetical protein ACT4P0_11170 [Panacagrimonas sp.]